MKQDPLKTDLVLLEKFIRGTERPDLDALRRKLKVMPEFKEVRLRRAGRSTVYASVPAQARDREKLKALVNEKVEGWSAIEETTYSVPRTF